MEKIKVGVRVRSLLEGEKSSQWCVEDNSIHQTRSPGQQFSPEVYQFDHVFGPETQTHEIFDVLGKPIVEGVINGVNGTIFAYGQTNSGKTYTMAGQEMIDGIIPLSFLYLFDRTEELTKTSNREFIIRISLLEIYNEQLTDLLKPDPDHRLKIREDMQRVIPIYVNELHEENISRVEEVRDYLIIGSKNRTVGETCMNKQSSRSHSLLAVTVESIDKENKDAVRLATLNLVDLAGSERARSTGAKGVRLTESTYINKSLFTLGSVISKLSDGKSHAHIPYRDSKLTRILQPSLGGNATTAIICTVSPTAVEETHSTLQFATRAKKISNKPVVNEVIVGEEELRKKLNFATDTITKLKEKLASSTSDKEKQILLERLAASEKLREEVSKRNEDLEKLIVGRPSLADHHLQNKQDFKQRHSMFVHNKTTSSAAFPLPGPLTTPVFLSPAVTRTRSRYTFIPTMHPLSSVSSPNDTEDEEFYSPSRVFTLTADRSTQTPSSLEGTLVPQSTASATSGSPLEQSTQTEGMIENKTHSDGVSSQSTQTEKMIEYKTHSDGVSCQSIQTEPMSMYNVASHEQSTQTTVSENHSVGVSSFLEQSTQTEEVTMSAVCSTVDQDQSHITMPSAARSSTERSTQTPSLRDLLANRPPSGCILSSLDISCDHRRLLKVIEDDLETVAYEKDEVILNNEYLESVVTDLQQALTQSAERRDISMVEKEELGAKLHQLKLKFEKTDQISIEVVQQNSMLKEAHAELQMQYEDIEEQLVELQVQCANLEQKSQLQETQLSDRDTQIVLLQQELAENTKLLGSQTEELNSLKDKFHSDLEKAQKTGMNTEEELRSRNSVIEQLEQQLATKTHSLTDYEEELTTLKSNLKHVVEMAEQRTTELNQAQRLKIEMAEELKEKNSKLQQLEQQLAELERNLASPAEELDDLKRKLKQEEDMTNYYTVQLSKAQQIEEDLDKELGEKDAKIDQLERQLAEVESLTGHTEELNALRKKLKQEEDMTNYYTVQLSKAQQIEEDLDKELGEKNTRIDQLEQQLAELERSHTSQLTGTQKAQRERDSIIRQLEEQLKEKEEELSRTKKSEPSRAAVSLSDQEQLKPQRKKATMSSWRQPLAHQQQAGSSVISPPDVNTSFTREELIIKIQILERQLAHASGGAVIDMQIRNSELEKENDRLRRQVQIEACRHRDYRGVELPDAVSVMKFDEMRCELRDLQQKSESDKKELSKLMSEYNRLKKTLESESELTKRYRHERSVYRSKYEHLKSLGTEVACQQHSVPAPEPYPERHQEINPPPPPHAAAADKPSDCKPQ